jgi:hypothetical protein
LSIYGFEIPHHKVKPARDYISIQLPFPPRKVGSVITPDIWREYSQHSTQAGIIRAMGPLAFKYKNEAGVAMHDAQIGDWVLIRWGAGSMFQANKGIVVSGGWRYITTFNDVIGIIAAIDMPDPATLEWEEGDDEKLGVIEPALPADIGVRERHIYRG